MGFGRQMQNEGGTHQVAPLHLRLTPRYRFGDSRIDEVEHPASTNHRLPRTSAFPVAWMPGPMLDASPEADTLERSAGR